MKGNSMKTYVKTSLALVASLVLLLGCSKQASTPTNSSAKEDKTAQSSENKQSNQQSSEKKEETKTHTFVHNSKPGIESTLAYTVKGDDILKQTVYNVFDPAKLDNTAEGIKEIVEDTYKGYEGVKGVTQKIEIKDEKVILSMEVDMTVATLADLKKAMPNEYYGIGNRVSFAASKKKLKEAGYTEQTN
jgi:hypothetical protein